MGKVITLVEPQKVCVGQILSYKNEFLEEYKSLYEEDDSEECSDIPADLKNMRISCCKDKAIDDNVKAITYMAITDEEELIGAVNIRLELNEFLLNIGGNIGYSVRKSEREKGYATEMLRLGLLKCKELELDKVLVTCNCDNIASEKVIIKNGGVFDNEIFDKGNDTKVKRFWIDLMDFN